MKKLFKRVMFSLIGILLIVELTISSNTIKAETISSKEKYYKEYKEIVENAKEKFNAKIELLPIDKIDEKTMMEPEKFKEVLDEIGMDEYKLKDVTSNGITHDPRDREIVLSAQSFDVNLSVKFDSECLFYRQSFIKAENIKSSGTNWQELSYDYNFYDGYRCADIRLSGNLSTSNIIWYDKKFTITFYCDPCGGIKC